MNHGKPAGILYDARLVASLLDLPFPEHESRSLGSPPSSAPGTYTLFDPGLSLVDLFQRSVVRRSRLMFFQEWYREYDWAVQQAAPGYRQLRVPVPKSFDLSYYRQAELLHPGEAAAKVRTVATLLVVHYVMSGQSLLHDRSKEQWVRCAEQVEGGHRVKVGRFGGGGFEVQYTLDCISEAGDGLAAERTLGTSA